MARFEQLIQIQGELFEDVQSSGIFSDSKTFVDSVPKTSPEQILKAYRVQKAKPDFDLETFVTRHFSLPQAAQADERFVLETSSLEAYISSLWPRLRREPEDYQRYDSLIPLKHPYIVPGGRFREIFYWDSYFTMLGLAERGELALIEAMLRNFLDLQEQLGLIPNGNRWYFASRSQPPYLSLMLLLLWDTFYCQQEGGLAHISQYLPALEQEYGFWMQASRSTLVADSYLLNHYWDSAASPRPEAFSEDVQLAKRSKQAPQTLYRHLRAAAESGWDFSSRWCLDPQNLGSIETCAILPVDLNCLLYKLEQSLAQFYGLLANSPKASHFAAQAEKRKTAIQAVFWQQDKGCYFDYHYLRKQPMTGYSLAAVMPLFVGLASFAQAEQIKNLLVARFLQPGGLVTSLETTGQQWDSPNGWAPLQYLAIQGLKNYGFEAEARTVALRWLTMLKVRFAQDKKLLEKYDVVDLSKEAGGGEYGVQEGFGWTNGVSLKLLHMYDF